MPLLLEEGNQEVETHKDVLSEFFLSHGLVTDGDVHASGLLKLELDGGSGIVDLGLEVIDVGDDLWEHTDSVENGSEHGWDFLDEGVGGEQDGVLLGPGLDELLVLVEGLEEIEIDGVDVDVSLLNDLKMLGITDEADLELWSWDVWESDGTSESLILLWVVILKTNLELDGFQELSLLLVGKDGVDTLGNLGLGKLGGSHTYLKVSSKIIFNTNFLIGYLLYSNNQTI